MNHGTASHRLRKSILWNYVVKCADDKCFQCGRIIEKIEELSIEHKIPWLHADNPVELFFSLDNIVFSHLSCNTRARRTDTVPSKYATKTERNRAKYEQYVKTTTPEFRKKKRREAYLRTGK